MIVNTSAVFKYIYLDDYGISLQGARDIIFMVKAENDAHIALSSVKGVWGSNSYEIVIGKTY